MLLGIAQLWKEADDLMKHWSERSDNLVHEQEGWDLLHK